MGYGATIRAIEAEERRQHRQERQRLRELERRAKEEARLSEIEQARLEVETFENQLELLRSVHKEQGHVWDWPAIVAALFPPSPARSSRNERRATQLAIASSGRAKEAARKSIEPARLLDDEEYRQATQEHTRQVTELQTLQTLGRRILYGDPQAFTEALLEVNPFAEISGLGSEINFTVHNPKVMEFVLKVNGKRAIPSEVKTLATTGKVSLKPMPKARFQEIFRDYVCSCLLRVARELFALFPLETVLGTAKVDSVDLQTGRELERPVLSAAMPRAIFAQLDLEQLDASDAIENFQHRGDFKASRKTDLFEWVTPLTLEDISQARIEDLSLEELLANVQKMRQQVEAEIAKLENPPDSQTTPSL